jgi:hypothetical protein
LDYDNIVDEKREDMKEERLIDELQYLQNRYQLGNFHVFDTENGGRHAVCIDALRLRDVIEIVDFSNCDLAFKKAPRINEYRCWNLRCYPKGNRPPTKYLYTLKSEYEGLNPQSRPHAKYLEKFGVKVDLKNPVGTEELEIGGYNTEDKTKKHHWYKRFLRLYARFLLRITGNLEHTQRST